MIIILFLLVFVISAVAALPVVGQIPPPPPPPTFFSPTQLSSPPPRVPFPPLPPSAGNQYRHTAPPLFPPGPPSLTLFRGTLHKGDTGDRVRWLQHILKTDPWIYPEGLVTGYYGSLTERAVIMLQRHYGLPETGILDNATQELLIPSNVVSTRISLISPTEGAEWNPEQPQVIEWSGTIGQFAHEGRPIFPGAVISGSSSRYIREPRDNFVAPAPLAISFFPRVALSLQRASDPLYERHIATVNLYAGYYKWHIPAGVENSNDYYVVMAGGPKIPCLFAAAQEKREITPFTCAAEATQFMPSKHFSIIGRKLTDGSVDAQRQQKLELIQHMRKRLQAMIVELNRLEAIIKSTDE